MLIKKRFIKITQPLSDCYIIHKPLFEKLLQSKTASAGLFLSANALGIKTYYAFLMRLLIVIAITKKTDAPNTASFFELSLILSKLHTFNTSLQRYSIHILTFCVMTLQKL